MEAVSNLMKRPYYMDSTTAKEFGVIDKVSAMLLDCYVLWFFTSCGIVDQSMLFACRSYGVVKKRSWQM